MMKLAVGEVVQGYRINRFLGRGGFASTYLAQHEESGNKVALKVGQSAGGGRQVTRLLEVTSRRTPEGISPDELPAEAVFFEAGGIRIDLLLIYPLLLLVSVVALIRFLMTRSPG